MGRLIYGLGSQNFVINCDDGLLRNVQAAMTTALHDGQSFFFRSDGDAGNGPTNTTILINPASQIAFIYEGAKIPDPDEDIVETLMGWIKENGGIPLDMLLAPADEGSGKTTDS